MSLLDINATINDVEVFWQPGTMRVSRSLAARGTCEFRIRAEKLTHLPAPPQVGDVVGVFDRGPRIFGGTIHNINLIPIAGRPGSEAWWNITATAWEHRLERRKIGAAAFSFAINNVQSVGDIVAQLLEPPYADYETTIGDIQPGASLEPNEVIFFRGVSVWEAIDELAQRSNYTHYIDPTGFFFFTPRKYIYAFSEVRASNLNYREPEVNINRDDYYNKISLAISYEAFDPLTLTFAGDETYPSFDVYDPSDPLKLPVPIDVIRTIRLNGVDQDFGVKLMDANGIITDVKTLYYTPGGSKVEWDPAQPVPSPDDVLVIEFYAVGANIVTAQDEGEIATLSARENSSGVYHAFQEDMDCKDAAVALKRCEAFLDLHAPARAGLASGSMPTEYKWVSDSHRFGENDGASWVEDLLPGRIITFWPSTPVNTSQELIVQSVEIRDLPSKNPEVFRYTVTALDTVRSADYLAFYRALAEVGPSQSGIRDFPNPVLANRTVIFGIDAPAVTTDVGWYVEIQLPAGQVWRPTSAWICAHVAPVGSSALIDCSYSVDSGATWANLFESAAGDLVLGAGLLQTETPLGRFSGFPEPLDIPAGALIRCAVIQVGSTSAGTAFLVNIAGEVRKATPVIQEP